MAGINEEPEIEIDEYEEIFGNWDQASVREGARDIRRSQSKTPHLIHNLTMTHTERPALRQIERSFAGEENESHPVGVKIRSSPDVLISRNWSL